MKESEKWHAQISNQLELKIKVLYHKIIFLFKRS